MQGPFKAQKPINQVDNKNVGSFRLTSVEAISVKKVCVSGP